MRSVGLGSSRWNKSRRSDGCNWFEDRWRIKAYGCGCGGFEDFGSLVLSLVLDHWVSNHWSLWFCVWIVGLLLKMDLWVCVCICVCFLADFWVCAFFFVFGWREIYCWVCICVIARDRFVFLCLADKRSTAGFVFLLEIGLCFCVWLTRKGKKILENLDMCSIFKIWVCGL